MAIYDGSDTPVSGWSLPLVKYSRGGYSAGVSVQHEFAFGVKLRKGSCLDECLCYFIEGLSLIRPPRERGVYSSNGVERSNQFGMPVNELTVIVSKTQNALHLSFVAGIFPASHFRDGFWIGLHALR